MCKPFDHAMPRKGSSFCKTFLAVLVGVAAIVAAVACQHWRTFRNVYTSQDLLTNYGDTAIVVGASEGLGAAWADLLCQNGFKVVTLARRHDELQARAAELEEKYDGAQVFPIQMDLLSDNLHDQFTSIFREHPSVGLMVYNAAAFSPGPFLDGGLDKQLSVLKINAQSTTEAVYAYASHMQSMQRNSSGLILMSSTLGEQGSGYVASYSASKAWNTVLAQSLGAEFAPGPDKAFGMDVLACVAGPIATPNFYRNKRDDKQAKDDPMLDFMMQQPQEVAEECLHALGGPAYAIGTGVIQKVFRFVVNRLLPPRTIVDHFTKMMEQDHRKQT